MADNHESTMKWKVDISELKSGMQEAKRSISLANAEFKTATAGLGKWQNSITGVEAKIKQLNAVNKDQHTILANLEDQYKIVAAEMGEDSAEAQRLKIAIENQKAAIAKTDAQLDQYNAQLGTLEAEQAEANTALGQLNKTISEQEKKLAELKKAYANAVLQYGENSDEAKNLANQIDQLSTELNENKNKLKEAETAANQFDAAMKKVESSEQKTVSAFDKLSSTIDQQETQLSDLKKEYANAVIQYGETSSEAQNLGSQIKDLSSELAENKQKMSDAETAADEMDETMKDLDKDTDEANGGFTVLKGTLANLASQAIMKLVDGFRQLGSAAVDAAKEAIQNYSEYEQLVGGVETLFKDSAGIVQQYAANAYKTAGLSANEYMSTVTSFSASLLQGLNGDTAKAAKVADTAITDMADNANKMGTSMGDIKNAYQGFAKQNYTMLDNLKLGYGGTKTEMERLLKDAEKMPEAMGKKFDLNNYADVIEAIHVVQKNMDISGYSVDELNKKLRDHSLTEAEVKKVAEDMGISYDEAMQKMKDGTLSAKDAQALLGTTAKEAATTIEGSGNAMKAAWTNFTVAMVDESQDAGESLNQLADSVFTYLDNVLPKVSQLGTAVGEMLPRIVEKFAGLAPELGQLGGELIMSLVNGLVASLPALLDAGLQIIIGLITGITSGMPQLLETLPLAISGMVQSLITALPQLVMAGLQLIFALVEGILAAMPLLVEQIPIIVQTIGDQLLGNLPLILEAGLEILLAVIEGITEAMPQLVAYVPQIIDTVCTVISQNLPLIVDAAIQIMVQLIQGLTQALPRLIQMVPQIITTIVNTLAKNLPQILKAGVQILTKLVEGIVSIIGNLKTAMGKVGSAIIDAVKSLPSKMLEMGKNLVKGIWNGISNSLSWIKGKIKGWVGNVTDFLKRLFKIGSPSKLMRDEIGKWLPAGIAEGFDEELPVSISIMKKNLNSALDDLKGNVAINTEGMFDGAASAAGGLVGNQQNITFNQYNNSPKSLDRLTIYRQTNSLLFAGKVALNNV